MTVSMTAAQQVAYRRGNFTTRGAGETLRALAQGTVGALPAA